MKPGLPVRSFPTSRGRSRALPGFLCPEAGRPPRSHAQAQRRTSVRRGQPLGPDAGGPVTWEPPRGAASPALCAWDPPPKESPAERPPETTGNTVRVSVSVAGKPFLLEDNDRAAVARAQRCRSERGLRTETTGPGRSLCLGATLCPPPRSPSGWGKGHSWRGFCRRPPLRSCFERGSQSQLHCIWGKTRSPSWEPPAGLQEEEQVRDTERRLRDAPQSKQVVKPAVTLGPEIRPGTLRDVTTLASARGSARDITERRTAQRGPPPWRREPWRGRQSTAPRGRHLPGSLRTPLPGEAALAAELRCAHAQFCKRRNRPGLWNSALWAAGAPRSSWW